MKKTIIIAAFAAISIVSCKKTETAATDVHADTTATAVAVPADSMPVTDSTVGGTVSNTVDSTAQGTTEVAEDVKNGAANAANGTGNPVNSGSAEVKDAANATTNGDGKLTK